jgi:hypothetical protein
MLGLETTRIDAENLFAGRVDVLVCSWIAEAGAAILILKVMGLQKTW